MYNRLTSLQWDLQVKPNWNFKHLARITYKQIEFGPLSEKVSTPAIEYMFQTKTEYLNLSVSQHDKRKKTVIKHLSCECQCRFDSIYVVRIRIGIMINTGVSAKI